MNLATEFANVLRVMKVFDDADSHGDLFWHVDGEDLHLFALCNDTFWWATADAEEITPDNLDVLEQTLRDVQALEAAREGPVTPTTCLPEVYLPDLFAARARGMRPQQPFYKRLSPELAALFDACGPVRDRKDEG